MFNLLRALTWLPEAYRQDSGELDVPQAFCTPGFWAVLACVARASNVGIGDLRFPNPGLSGYASAVGLPMALGGDDNYPHARLRDGLNYSSIEHLESENATEGATQRVIGCIRALFHDAGHHRFVGEMCGVVSELHSNVWDHGMSSGFSMAQRWPKRGQFEFAIADGGIGFLREIHRVGGAATNDAGAIDWCIQEGMSTKRAEVDAFAQRLPGDAIGNPMPGVSRTYGSGTHHAGLGLWKLQTLVQVFSGEAWIASGGACLHISPSGRRFWPVPSWQGVAIACRFSEQGIQAAPTAAAHPRVRAIMAMLRGIE